MTRWKRWGQAALAAALLAGCASATRYDDGGDGGPTADGSPQDPDGAPPCTPAAERCNGVDDDCNGLIDDGFDGLGETCSAGMGACAGEGVVICTADGVGTRCDAAPGQPGEETCNGVDDDCDGLVDDGFAGVGEPCAVGVGACAAEGVNVCRADGAGVECGASPGPSGPEQCNGLDDDCDGASDEEVDGSPCDTGLLGVCGVGAATCADGVAGCVQSAQPTEEICDGLDDDCDGEVDDVVGLGAPCTAGLGACAVAGVTVCGPDGPTCDAMPGPAGAELCNGVDDDCDGAVDNDPGDCAAGERCVGGACQPALVAGVQRNVDVAAVTARGYQICHQSAYNAGGLALAQIQANCQGEHVMMACRQAGAAVYTLAAEGEYAEVFRDVGNDRNASHGHNGVQWYYSPTWSWGFAPGGEPVNRFSCDYNEGGQSVPGQRMCIHTSEGAVQPGYRCGANDLNAAGGWERVILRR